MPRFSKPRSLTSGSWHDGIACTGVGCESGDRKGFVGWARMTDFYVLGVCSVVDLLSERKDMRNVYITPNRRYIQSVAHIQKLSE